MGESAGLIRISERVECTFQVSEDDSTPGKITTPADDKEQNALLEQYIDLSVSVGYQAE